MDSAVVGPFDYTAGFLVTLAALRSMWLVISSDDAVALELWRRRWVEVLGMILVAVVLFFLGRLAV